MLSTEQVVSVKAEIMAGEAAARRLAVAQLALPGGGSPAFDSGVLVGLQRAMSIIEGYIPD